MVGLEADGTPTFPLVLLLGISLWNFFAEATNMGLTAIVGRGDILRKIHFPNYIIVVSATVGALISLAINMCVVLVFCIFNQVHFTWNVLWLPLNFIEFYALALGTALLLAAYLGSAHAGVLLCNAYYLSSVAGN